MPQAIIRYALDTTGVNADNLIRNEPHTLAADKRFRAIAPTFGAFYTKGFSITDTANSKILTQGVDYVFAELYQTPSIKYGQEVCGVALVINPTVSNDVTITYQCLGSDYSDNVNALANFLASRTGEQLSTSYLDVANKPATFVPQAHTHDLGDGMGFEFLIFALERLRNALIWADADSIFSLQVKVDGAIDDVIAASRIRLDNELSQFLMDYKKNFSKEMLGLDKVVNMPSANENDGVYAARPDYNLGAEINNRYVTLRSLVAFKQEFLSRVVSSDTTWLGKRYGQLMIPTYAGLESLTNGAKVLIDTLEATLLSGVTFDKAIYPDLTNPSVRWGITKVTNNATDRGGIFSAVNMSTGEFYTGVLSTATTLRSIAWKKFLTQADADSVIGKLNSHIADVRNPHKTDKVQVQLGHVENLAVAERETILARKPVREYVTYDGFLLFMKAFVTNNWQLDITQDNPDEAVQAAKIARYQTLFAPCGDCGSGSGLTLEQAPRATNAPVPPRGTSMGWYCDGTSKVTKYTDGLGGYYVDTQTQATDCGWVSPSANFSIKDLNGIVLGLGFPAGGTVEADATIRLDDADGIPLCFIYPTAATGRTAEIRNASGQTLGFAVNA